MVEAIRYEHMPLYTEKLIIQAAVAELIDTISHQDKKLNLLEQYTSEYLGYIKSYQSGALDFTNLLQKLQPLQAIPNHDHNKNIDEFNAIVVIINALNHSPHHEPVLKEQCLRIQEILDPEHMPLVIETLKCWN